MKARPWLGISPLNTLWPLVQGKLLTHIFPGRRLRSLCFAPRSSAAGPLFICAVGLHHLTLLIGDDMLLFAWFLAWGGTRQKISSLRRHCEAWGLGREDRSWGCRWGDGKSCKTINILIIYIIIFFMMSCHWFNLLRMDRKWYYLYRVFQ